MGAKIAVVDYRKGNLASVQRCLVDAGYDARTTTNPADLLNADGIVLPGVGSFGDAMTTMNEMGQSDALKTALSDGVPFLGICLGLHLLFDWGDEGLETGERMEGLGMITGHIERMASHDEAGNKYKIPHVGWNSAEYTQNGRESELLAGVPEGTHFYFTHSYCAVPDEESAIITTTEHARRFCSGVRKGNIFGVQFHPEKSSAHGLTVFKNFGRIVDSLA